MIFGTVRARSERMFVIRCYRAEHRAVGACHARVCAVPAVLDQVAIEIDAGNEQCQLAEQEVIFGQAGNVQTPLGRHRADKVLAIARA